MQQSWIFAFSFVLIAALVVSGLLLAARLLRVRSRVESPLRRHTYECGEEPEGPVWVRFHSRYYVVALFFVLFDVEAALLFPWAVALDDLGAMGLLGMSFFVAILMLGWLYAIRKGALRWQ